MQTLDWIIAIVPLIFVIGVGLYSRLFVRSVADFMAANRSAGRYLLCIAGGELQAGAVIFAAAFEAFNQAGSTDAFWGNITPPIILMISITGFVGYRYRETRVMTLAQFFEIRYNRAFRIFTGCLGYFAGILNFGVIPAVGARVMVYFLDLPENIHFFSQPVAPGTALTTAPLTFANFHEATSVILPTYIPLMAFFLCITLFIAMSGGVITVMMIDTTEGIISQIGYLIIIVTILSLFTWSQMTHAFVARPPGHSMVNPFDSFSNKGFNLWSTLMNLWLMVYALKAWQNASGYGGAALNAHEGRMGGILTAWREMGKNAVIAFLAMGAYTYLHNQDFSAGAALVQARLNQIGDEHLQSQMQSVVALAFLLPVGVKGLLCAILMMGIFGGDATHLHSWGGIFIQDIVMPLRGKRLSTRAHLWALRASIAFVAIFAFVFGISFTLVDYIRMWWSLTMAIFVGGAGAVIIGGLYWKKGTTTGAFVAFILGSSLAVTGIIVQKYWVIVYKQDFWLNGQQIGFFVSLIAAASYVVVSLLTYREDFNLERMLHRGKYADVLPVVGDAPTPHRKQPYLSRILGFDSDFTKGDRWVTGGLLAWQLFNTALFIVICVWNLGFWLWPTSWWLNYRYIFGVCLPVVFAVITSVWFTWGGIRDMRRLFKRLRTEKVNDLDDGTVTKDHENLDEAAAEQAMKK